MVCPSYVHIVLPVSIVEGDYNIMSCRDLHNNGWDFSYGDIPTLKNGHDAPIVLLKQLSPELSVEFGAIRSTEPLAETSAETGAEPKDELSTETSAENEPKDKLSTKHHFAEYSKETGPNATQDRDTSTHLETERSRVLHAHNMTTSINTVTSEEYSKEPRSNPQSKEHSGPSPTELLRQHKRVHLSRPRRARLRNQHRAPRSDHRFDIIAEAIPVLDTFGKINTLAKEAPVQAPEATFDQPFQRVWTYQSDAFTSLDFSSIRFFQLFRFATRHVLICSSTSIELPYVRRQGSPMSHGRLATCGLLTSHRED